MTTPGSDPDSSTQDPNPDPDDAGVPPTADPGDSSGVAPDAGAELGLGEGNSFEPEEDGTAVPPS